MPAVSIIVPVYNVQPYLSRCIDSILKQSFVDFEVVLVDDGSTDNCPSICDNYSKSDTRIIVLHKENAGLTSARKAGYDLSHGDYVIFIDSDDYISPNMIEKLNGIIIEESADMAICSYFVVKRNMPTAVRLQIPQATIEKSQINQDYVLPIIGHIDAKGYVNIPGFLCIRLFRKNLITDSCFVSERDFFTEDDIFNIVISKELNKIAIYNESLYYYCQNEGSLTNRYREKSWEMLMNRYKYCRNYCLENGMCKVSETRLFFAFYKAIIYSIDNACKQKNSKVVLNELSNIHNDCKNFFDKFFLYKHLLPRKQKYIIWLFMWKMYWILFLMKQTKKFYLKGDNS